METLTVAGLTEVLIGEGLPSPLLPPRASRHRAVILTQPGAMQMAAEVARLLGEEEVATEVMGLADGEQAKTLETTASVYDALAKSRLSRDDTVVGVGGGSVTDVAGFVAGTWLRGVEAVHVPTTLVGAVDAAIGGKAGVNFVGKNLVGVIWHPSRVVIDTTVLSSLPIHLVREGMAEALKAGLVGDSDLCALLAGQGVQAQIGEVVSRAVAVKARIVAEDERDRGVRAYLNFGHTIGHAIERASGLSHGQSIALGMIGAAHVSQRVHGFAGVDLVTETVEGLGLSTSAEGVDVARVVELMQLDKKREGDVVRMVLLRDIQDPVLERVEQADIETGLAAIGL